MVADLTPVQTHRRTCTYGARTVADRRRRGCGSGPLRHCELPIVEAVVVELTPLRMIGEEMLGGTTQHCAVVEEVWW